MGSRKVSVDRLLQAMQGSCSTCLHWEREGQEEVGDCHRYPPTVIYAPDSEGQGDCFSVFPQTDLTDQCGEFKPKQ